LLSRWLSVAKKFLPFEQFSCFENCRVPAWSTIGIKPPQIRPPACSNVCGKKEIAYFRQSPENSNNSDFLMLTENPVANIYAKPSTTTLVLPVELVGG